MKNNLPSDATLIRRAGILERLAKSLHNESKQGVVDAHDRENVLEILYKMQRVIYTTIAGK